MRPQGRAKLRGVRPTTSSFSRHCLALRRSLVGIRRRLHDCEATEAVSAFGAGHRDWERSAGARQIFTRCRCGYGDSGRRQKQEERVRETVSWALRNKLCRCRSLLRFRGVARSGRTFQVADLRWPSYVSRPQRLCVTSSAPAKPHPLPHSHRHRRCARLCPSPRSPTTTMFCKFLWRIHACRH